MCQALCLGMGGIRVNQPDISIIHPLPPLPLSSEPKPPSSLTWVIVIASSWLSCSVLWKQWLCHSSAQTPFVALHVAQNKNWSPYSGHRDPTWSGPLHYHLSSCRSPPWLLFQLHWLPGCSLTMPGMLPSQGREGLLSQYPPVWDVLTPETHTVHFHIHLKTLLKCHLFNEDFSDHPIDNCNICLTPRFSTSFSLYIFTIQFIFVYFLSLECKLYEGRHFFPVSVTAVWRMASLLFLTFIYLTNT